MMGLFVVSYDLRIEYNAHSSVKARLLDNGFAAYLKSPSGVSQLLPNTTVTVAASSADEALELFTTQVKAVVSAAAISGAVALEVGAYALLADGKLVH